FLEEVVALEPRSRVAASSLCKLDRVVVETPAPTLATRHARRLRRSPVATAEHSLTLGYSLRTIRVKPATKIVVSAQPSRITLQSTQRSQLVGIHLLASPRSMIGT